MVNITVLTPTFNRAHSLPKVYNSLLNQDSSLFEWLVIDDGSTDATENYISELQHNSFIKIRYHYQKNGGKHRAHNAGVLLAKGVLTIILDSDDQLAENAIRIIWDSWNSISEQDKDDYAGIWANCIDQNGVIIGKETKSPFIEGRLFDLIERNIISGEKLPCFRTDLLKMFPFPKKENCNQYVPEGVIWLKIAEKHKIRILSNNLRIYHKSHNDKNSIMHKIKEKNYADWGKLMFSITVLNLISNYFPRHCFTFLKHIIIFIFIVKRNDYNLYHYIKMIDFKFIRYLAIALYPLAIFFQKE